MFKLISTTSGRGTRAPGLLWGLVLLSAVVFSLLKVADGVRLESDILKLLPQDSRSPVLRSATDHFLREISQRVLVLFGSESFSISSDAAEKFAGDLRASELFSEVILTQPYNMQEEFRRLYFPYRTGLYSSDLLKLISGPSPVDDLSGRVHQILANPLSGDAGRDIKDDPLLLFSDFLQSLSFVNEGMWIKSGYLMANLEGREHIVLQATLGRNVFDRRFQRKVSTLLRDTEVSVRKVFPLVRVLQFGAVHFAAEMSEAAEKDVRLIGWGSLLGVCLLMLLAFRSPFPLFVTAFTVGGGIACAFAASVLVFDSLHAMTLAFGATLIGVCSDYTLHFYCHRFHEPKVASATVVRAVFPGMALGMMTTSLGYLVLYSVPFPGLYQMSFFSIVGMCATFLTIVLLYPLLPPPGCSRAAASFNFGRHYITTLKRLFQTQQIRIVLWLGVLCLLPGIALLEVNDDVRKLQAPPARLVEAEQRVSKSLGGVDKGRFLVSCAESEEQVLVKEERVAAELDRAVESGTVAGYTALSQFVPSAAKQQRRARALVDMLHEHQASLQARLEDVGYDPSTLEDTFGKIRENSYAPLTVDEWLKSPLSSFIKVLNVRSDGTAHCTVLLLRGVASSEYLQRLSETIPDLYFVDLAGDATRVLSTYREFSSFGICGCYCLVVLVLIFRYGFSLGLRALVPALGALYASLAICGYSGVPITLFSVLANAIVLGLAVDYSIFVLEAKRDPGVSTLAIILSGLSTILSFGLLSLSGAAVLRYFGITLFLGVLFSLLLFPIVLSSKNEVEAKGVE